MIPRTLIRDGIAEFQTNIIRALALLGQIALVLLLVTMFAVLVFALLFGPL